MSGLRVQYVMRKAYKRLTIIDMASGETVYTPPDFVRAQMRGRAELSRVVAWFNLCGQYDIDSVIKFEAAVMDEPKVLRALRMVRQLRVLPSEYWNAFFAASSYPFEYDDQSESLRDLYRDFCTDVWP